MPKFEISVHVAAKKASNHYISAATFPETKSYNAVPTFQLRFCQI